MRTYLGKVLDKNLINEKGFAATVREDGFDVDDAILGVALRDEQKYYPEDYAAYEESVATVEETAPVVDDKPKYVPSPTFAQKMLRADEVIQDRYDELKNYALRFKKLKSRISKKFDSINQGRLHFVKLSVAGKT